MKFQQPVANTSSHTSLLKDDKGNSGYWDFCTLKSNFKCFGFLHKWEVAHLCRVKSDYLIEPVTFSPPPSPIPTPNFTFTFTLDSLLKHIHLKQALLTHECSVITVYYNIDLM